MSFFEFPHTRTYDTDLGWIIKHLGELLQDTAALQAWAGEHKEQYKELADKVDGLINNLVDVIVPWDSSIAYHIFSIVEYQGTNYIAVQDVPVGAMITNTDYWQPANTVVEQINAIGTTVSELKETTEPYVKINQEIGLMFPGMNMSIDPNGLCCVFYLEGHAVLIDMGDYSVFNDIKEQLNALNITDIDAVFFTHYHRDHTGAIENAAPGAAYDPWKNAFNMEDTIFYLPPDRGAYTADNIIASFPGNTFIRMENGAIYEWNNIKFTPYNISNADFAYYEEQDPNDYNSFSALIYADYKNSSFLCTADATPTSQAHCYDQGYLRHADIMTAPHHGRNQDSDSNFIIAISPMFVYIPAGTAYAETGLRDKSIAVASNFATIFCNEYNSESIKFTLGKATISAAGRPMIVSQYSTESANHIYVNESYTGVDRDGTKNRPFTSIRRAISACKGSSIIELLSDVTSTAVFNSSNGYIEVIGNSHSLKASPSMVNGANVYIHDATIEAQSFVYDSWVKIIRCIFNNQIRAERSKIHLENCTWSGTGFTNCMYIRWSELYMVTPTVTAGTDAASLITANDSVLLGNFTVGNLSGVRAINSQRSIMQLGRLVDTAASINAMFTTATNRPPFVFDLTNNKLIVTASDGTTREITADT